MNDEFYFCLKVLIFIVVEVEILNAEFNSVTSKSTHLLEVFLNKGRRPFLRSSQKLSNQS